MTSVPLQAFTDESVMNVLGSVLAELCQKVSVLSLRLLYFFSVKALYP